MPTTLGPSKTRQSVVDRQVSPPAMGGQQKYIQPRRLSSEDTPGRHASSMSPRRQAPRSIFQPHSPNESERHSAQVVREVQGSGDGDGESDSEGSCEGVSETDVDEDRLPDSESDRDSDKTSDSATGSFRENRYAEPDRSPLSSSRCAPTTRVPHPRSTPPSAASGRC